MRPKFSVVCIAKNEAKTLPRLLSSLNEFKVRGGEIIVIDTGSSDSTVKTALDLGCTVFEEGARFIKTISAFDAERINEKFVHSSEDAVVHTGDKLFDFSAARNYAATQASNDWVCMIDCDEVLTTLDLDALDKILDTPKLSRIEFEFVYAHDQFDRPLIQFRMSRFYHRRKVYWNPKCIVHEILTPVEGADTGTFYVGENILKSDHYQNQETSRSGYLTGLALDCYLNPENDRNSHYFGRELFYRGRYRSAITEFQRHVAMNGWGVERAQSMVYIGDCFKALGNEEEALAWWNKAFLADGTRREPLMRLAWFFYGKDDKHKTAAYASAAMALPRVGCYMDNESQYRQEPCELLYWALWYLGDKEGSAVHWRKAVGYQPLNSKYLNDGQFYVNPGLGLEAFKKALIERQPFSFVKLGDGERACMAGETGANCDGQPYSTALALALKQAYEFLVGKVHVVDFSNQNSFNLLLHRTGNNLAEVKSFWRTIIDLPSRKVFVGPARLRPVADLLKASFVEVPVENAFSEYEEIKTRMGYYYKRGSVFIFSAGMTAKLIIADLLKWCADITCIDAGSAFDPLFVGETRTFQVPQKVLQRLYFGGEEQEIEQPHVTICIPTLGREEKLEQLLQSLPFTAQYSNFDVLVEHDSFEKRQGVPALLKKMVSQAKGEFIVFLGNDCMPRPGWLREAMQAMRQNFPAMDGLVGLNDGYWHGEVATHWLASKKLLPFLDGEFFHTGYSHVGCDNELTARCKKAGKYTWCGAAQIYHDHPIQHGFKEDSLDPVYKLAWHPVSVANDRALLKSRAEYLDFASHLIL